MRAPRTLAPGRVAPSWLLPLLLLVALRAGLAAPCVSGGLPKPTNLTFLSINMKNVLQWNPPESLQGVDVTYTVQYFIYGQKKWLNTYECRNISRTYCDLSAETSDYEHQYYGKVKAIWETNCSKWAETGRFYPFLETQVGPPEVALTTGEKSISIVLKPPEKWKRNPEDSSVSMQQIFSNMKYNVSVYNTKSHKMWSQCVTNHTLVLTWLEPDTLYCVRAASFIPGPPRLAQPSEKQCISTPKDQTSALKIKIIFWYVLPISVTVFLVSVMAYSIYRYVHVSKEKHPANLILIYGNDFDKRFFVPAEKVVINFITLSILDDSKVAHKDMSTLEKSSHGDGDVSNPGAGEPGRTLGTLQEEAEVQHLGYASHLLEISSDSVEDTRCASGAQQEPLLRTIPIPTGNMAVEYEHDVRTTDLWARPEDQELTLQKESIQGKVLERQAALANLSPQAFLSSYSPQLRDLDHGTQEGADSEEEPEQEPSMTLVDWDPRTGRLYIPSLSNLEQDSAGWGHSEYGGFTEQGLLSTLYEEQAPDKPLVENETYLTQFMEEWGLYVQMEN